MSRGRALLKRFGVEVREGEAIAAVLLFLGFFLIITFQYTAKTVRQSTFIDTLGAELLPVVFLLVALFSYPPLALYNRYADRVARHRLLIVSCVIVAASMVAVYFAFQLGTKTVPVVYYVWVSIVFVLTVSQFWLYASNVLDPRQAKRLFGVAEQPAAAVRQGGSWAASRAARWRASSRPPSAPTPLFSWPPRCSAAWW